MKLWFIDLGKRLEKYKWFNKPEEFCVIYVFNGEGPAAVTSAS